MKAFTLFTYTLINYNQINQTDNQQKQLHIINFILVEKTFMVLGNPQKLQK